MSEGMIHDQCGVFGILGNRDAARLTYLGLYALQHRGQESAGIVTSESGQVHLHKGMGQVADVFDDQNILERLKGDIAIGHTRYSTTGASSLINIQPFLITNRDKYLAVGHNGNLTNSLELRKRLDAKYEIKVRLSETDKNIVEYPV